MDKGTLGIHQVKLVVKTSPGFSNGSGVAQHAHGTGDLGKIATRDHGGRLVVDANLESSGAPVNKLDGPLGLDSGNGSIDILGDNVSTVEHAAGHVFAVTGIALHHLVDRLEAGIGDLSNRELLVVGLLSRDDRSIGDQREMNPGVGHQVGLELSQINIEGSIEAKRGGDGRDDLANEPVQVGVGGTINVKVAAADVIDGLIVNHEGTVRVLQSGVGGQDGIVGLNHSSGHLRGRVDGELKLGLLAIVNREALHEQRGESRASATSKGVEDEESLESCALVSQLADPVQDQVDNLLANGVVAAGIVVGGVFLSSDELLRVEELPVGAGTHLINDGGLQVNKDSAGHVLASASLHEEGVEGVISAAQGLVGGHLTVGLDAVLQAVQLPAAIANLAAGLANMDGNALTLRKKNRNEAHFL